MANLKNKLQKIALNLLSHSFSYYITIKWTQRFFESNPLPKSTILSAGMVRFTSHRMTTETIIFNCASCFAENAGALRVGM